ncbi:MULTISPECIES: sensor histidine kinase [Gordonia]|uniref:Signal transduction histidine-protein kinase/phosphatase MprB n=1 Tax=Gordonia aquimaris TaxID=2984863 RepID=A0A9X3D797_9ACTN|nr:MULTISPECIES: HAMP domain-containing sensor histidine kinase [Gordonia]MAU83647.1 ATP-binding protein [Gordonia sp. (in: high G+C Gram-positive bacteria)]MCX2964972.1 HAMP domain-containing sensor histidine kinase [Gordonia aquimaris]
MRRRILNTMIAMCLAVGLLLGVPLSVIAWWWVSDNAHQTLDGRLKLISDQLIRQEGEAGSLAPGQLDVDAFRLLIPENGRLTVRYPVDGGADAMVVIGDRIDGAAMGDSIGLGNAGSLLLEIPLEQVRDDQLVAVGIVLLVVASSIAAGTIVAAVTAGRIADPLIDLADRAAAMARGDFRSDWKSYGIGELDRVSRALGDANAEIALRLEREGEIVGDVSHQLRSRLTAIQLRLDELSMHPDPSVVGEAEAALEQVERLSRELDEMVAASRNDPAVPDDIDVAELVNTLIGDFRASFEAAGRTISARFDGRATAVSARPGRLREALSVLVDNALQHGGGTCHIQVDDLPSGEMLRVSVSDEGDGVPDPLVGHIFRRGFSAGRGNGVGLSLARALVEADGGRLDLTSRRPAVFSLVIPSTHGSRLGGAVDGDPPTGETEIRRDRVPHR